MRPNWTRMMMALLPALTLGAGCSGINASRSVSPLDFLIPGGGGLLRGIMYNEPTGLPTPSPADAPAFPVPPTKVASAN